MVASGIRRYPYQQPYSSAARASIRMVTLPEPSLNGHGGPPLPPPVTFAPPNSPSPSRARWSLRRDSTSTHRGSWSPDTRRSSSASRGSRDRLWRPHSTLVRGPGSQVDPTAEKAQRHRPVQQPFLHKLPRLVSHFFGYRRAKEERLSLIPLLNRLQPRVEEALITFIAVFGSMLLVAAVTMAFSLEYRTVPLAIAALGATAVLVYAVPASPLSQPRNVTGGHLIACVVGLVVSSCLRISNPCITIRPLAAVMPFSDPVVLGSLSWRTCSIARRASPPRQSSPTPRCMISSTWYPSPSRSALRSLYR